MNIPFLILFSKKKVKFNLLSGHQEDIEFFIIDEKYKISNRYEYSSYCVLKKNINDLPIVCVRKTNSKNR